MKSNTWKTQPRCRPPLSLPNRPSVSKLFQISNSPTPTNFIPKSKNGNSLLQEMERRASRLQEEIDELRRKIDMIDGKMN